MVAHYNVNFSAANNEDLRQPFRLTDEADVPSDLTGATLSMSFEDANLNDVLAASTANGRIVITAPLTGDFEVRIPAAVLAPIRSGVYAHDLVWTSAAGVVRRVWRGTLALDRGVT